MNIRIISVDSLRYDVFGHGDLYLFKKHNLLSYIYPKNMESLAAKGSLFINSFSCAPHTPPPHASMLTGVYPYRHKVRSFFGSTLSKSAKTIFEIFSREGYETIFATDASFFKILDMVRGAKHYIFQNDNDLFSLLFKLKDKKILLFFHLFDVHPPYLHSFSPPQKSYNDYFFKEMDLLFKRFKIYVDGNPKDDPFLYWSTFVRFLEERGIACEVLVPLYVKGVNRFDRGRFKRILDTLKDLGILDRSLLFVTSDHGQEEFSYARDGNIIKTFGHGYRTLEGILRVPIIVFGPNVPKGKVFNKVVSPCDILPTIFDVLGKDIDVKVDGVSLFSEKDRWAYAEWAKDQFFDENVDVFSYARMCEEKGRFIPSRWRLLERAIKKGDFKYVEEGDFIEKSCDKEKFLEELFYDAFGVQISENQKRIFLKKKKDELFRIFSLFKIQGARKCALYDLSVSSKEELNLLGKGGKRDIEKALSLKKVLDSIPLFTDAEEQDVEDMYFVANQLRDLGYF